MDYKRLLQQKADLTAQGKAILAGPAGEDGNLTEAQKTEHDTVMADLESVNADLARVKAQLDAEARLATFPDPEHDRPAAGGPRTSQFHDNREDAPFASMGEFFHAVAQVGMNAGYDTRLAPLAAATGLGGATPADGGFLVQKDYSTVLLDAARETSVLYPRVRKITIGPNSNGIQLPFIDQTSRASGSRFGGLQFYWGDEGTAPTASRPKVGRLNIDLMKCSALCYATEELLADAVALESLINSTFPSEAAAEMDDMMINGNGAGRPLGILNAPGLVTITKESGQAAATVVFNNVAKMFARGLGSNFLWLHNRDIMPQLFQLQIPVGTGGTALFLGPGQVSGAPANSLLGPPLQELEHCPTLGTVGDLIFADLSQYLVIEKGGLETTSSMHVRFLQGEMAFRFVFRMNGQPIGSAALTPAKGSNTRSPFVVLETRS